MNDNNYTDLFLGGDQYVPHTMMHGPHVGGTKVGGMWTHFQNIPPSCGGYPYDHHHGHHHNHGNHEYANPPHTHTAEEMKNFYPGHNSITNSVDFRLYAGNLHQIQRLEKLVKERKSIKKIYVDLDGVLSSYFINSPFSMLGKTPQFFLKNAMIMLRFYGFEVIGITTDTPGACADIDQQILNYAGFDRLETVLDIGGKFAHIQKTNDISKIFYISDDLFGMPMASGRRSPITMCTSNAMYMTKNLAHYVSLTSGHDYSFMDFATSILRAFGINAVSYISKFRRNIAIDTKQNKEFNVGFNVAFTENSQKWNSTYSNILTSVYGVDMDNINMAVSFVQTDNKSSLDDIYITTDLQYFIQNFDRLKNNRVYILLSPFDINLLTTKEMIKSLDKLYFVGLEWTLLIQHIGDDQKQLLYPYCLENKLYNVLSMTDGYFPDVPTPSI